MQAIVLGPSLSYVFRSIEGTKSFYDLTKPEVIDEIWRQMNFNDPFYICMAAAQDLNIPRDALVLDVGCGTGKIA